MIKRIIKQIETPTELIDEIIGQLGGGGSSEQYIDGEVEYHADLPTGVPPATNTAYLVKKGQGVWLINRKPAGIWVRETDNGDLNDWVYAGSFPDVYNDANFRIYDNDDSSKNLAFNLDNLNTNSTVTLTIPTTGGTVITSQNTGIFYTNDNPSGFITGENNAFKANYLVLDSGNDTIYQRELHSNLFGRKGNIQLKNTVLPNLTSGDFVFHTIYPDSERLDIGKTILLAKPYLTVKNTDNSQDSYYPESGGGPDPISSTNFVNLNPEGPHSGLALQHVRFHPIIQNAYKKYDLRFGQDIAIPMSNRYLESFIEIVWPSGEYWSVTNSGIDKYIYDVNINPPKNQAFTQSHVVNFKIIFEQDDRVGTVTNYDSRVINFNYYSSYGNSSFSISGLDYEFTQKERVILTTTNAMQRW